MDPSLPVIAPSADRFGLRRAGSTPLGEIIAGITTFGAMSYIVAVNPAILATTGADRHDLVIVTALAACVGTLLMALLARLPIALAPGMGSNIVFAQIVVVRMGLSYGTALAMVLIGGILFLALSVSRWRSRMVDGFPDGIRIGMQCGLGLFIATIGLHGGGLVVAGHHGPAFGDLRMPAVLLVFAGLLATTMLLMRRVPAALLLSIAGLTIAGLFVPLPSGGMVTPMPVHVVSLPVVPRHLLFAWDFREFFAHFFLVLPITFYFFLSDFFSATATLIAVTRRAGLLDAEGRILNGRRAYLADGLASIIGSALGSPTVVAYVESAAGVESGGRTALTGLVVAFLFFCAIFFWPLLAIIPPQATAPALVVVGLLMMQGFAQLAVDRLEESIPAVLILLITVTTSDLMMGICTGCFAYTLMMLARGAWRSLFPVMYAVDAVLVFYIFLSRATH